MKVYIGPYRNRWISNVHTKYMEKKHGLVDWPEYGQKGMIHKTEPMREAFIRKLEDGLQWVYNHTINLILDRLQGQRMNIRIDKYDTWSMDHTLAPIILPMLKQLKETKHGSPFVDMTDVPQELRVNDPEAKEFWDNGDIDDKHHARWDWVLDEMIWAFEQKTYDWEEQYTTGEYDFRFEKTADGKYSEMVEGPNHTAVTDWDGRKKHQERMSNGFRLFGKYYEALWD